MKKVVVAFGRMNPPTIGHKKLADKINAIARKENADARIYLSHTSLQTDPKNKKDPLSYDQKVKFARKAFGSMVTTSNARTLIDVMKELQKQGYTDVVKVAGSDRVQEYKTLLNKYNGKDYTFDSIKVVSAGERDPDAQGATGMSASKMRAAVQDDDFASFKLGTPKGVDAKQMFDAVKKSMGLNEMLEEELQLTEADLEVDDDELDDELFGIDTNDDGEFTELDPHDDDMSALDILIPDDDLEKGDEEEDGEQEEEMDLQERKPLTLQQRLKMGRRMKRLAPRLARYRKIKAKRVAPPDRLQYRARKAALKLLRKKVAGKMGDNYKNLSPAQKISVDNMLQKKLPAVTALAKRMLPKIRKAEMERVKKARSAKSESVDFAFEDFLMEKTEVPQDRDVAKLPGTQPKKYYKGLSDKEKEARAKQFAKGADKPDDDPASYTPAPGDADAETKPSKYTVKYKKMYGEEVSIELDEADLSDKAMMMRLTTKAMKALSGSRKQKELIKQVNVYREKLGMKLINSQWDIVPFRVSGISGEYNPKVNEAFEAELATDEAFDELVEALEQLDEKKGKRILKAYSVYHADPTKSPLSHAIPTSNYQIEADDMLTPRINSLLRMGLAKASDLEKYRRALKSGEKGLTNPILRKALLDVLDKLINIVNDDSTAFQRVRNAVLKGRTDTGPIDEGEMVDRTKERHRNERERMKRQHDAELDRARLQDVRTQNRQESFDDLEEKSIEGLKKKSDKSGIPYGILKKVYDRGMAAWKTGHRPGTTPQQWAFARVNSFLTGGKTRTTADADLWAKARESKKESVEESLGVPFARTKVPAGSELEEMPRWLLEPLSKITHKKGYEAAKKVLKDVLSRKKKEAGRKGLQHSIEYYAQQIARQFDGVDARILAGMVNEEPEILGPVEVGTDEIRKRYADMTPGQSESYPRGMVKVEDLDESLMTEKPVGTGFTLYAKDFGLKVPNTFEHHPDTIREMEAIERQKQKSNPLKEAVLYHQRNNLPIKENIFRPHSDMYYRFFCECRRLWENGELEVNDSFDRMLLESDAGLLGMYEGKEVPLDIPLVEADDDVELNKPKRGGPKKFYVFVKDPSTGNVKKITFGDTTGLSAKINDPEARKSFAARHRCDMQKDKTTAAYWACRLPYYAKELGLKGGGSFFW